MKPPTRPSRPGSRTPPVPRLPANSPLVRELETIERGLPMVDAMQSYGELRAMLARLPRGLAPIVLSARAGGEEILDLNAPEALDLADEDIGQLSGAAIGRYPELFYGPANLIENPLLLSIWRRTLTTSWQLIGPGWEACYVANGGASPPAGLAIESTYDREDEVNNPLGTALLSIVHAATTGAWNVDVLVRSAPWLPAVAWDVSHLVAAVRLVLGTSTVDPDYTACTAQIEIVRVSDGVAVASSGLLDAKATDNSDLTRIRVAFALAGVSLPSDTWRWQLRVVLRKDNAATTANLELQFGEPQLQLSTTEQPGPFAPLIAKTQFLVINNFQPYALPIGGSPADALSTTLVVPGNGGTVLVPIELSAHMRLSQVVAHFTAASGAWEWRLYHDRLNNANAIRSITSANGTGAAVGAAANTGSAPVAPPIFLTPGIYYLAIRSTTATDLWLGCRPSGTMALTAIKTKTLAAALPSALDIVTGWTGNAALPGVWLRGDYAGAATWA